MKDATAMDATTRDVATKDAAEEDEIFFNKNEFGLFLERSVISVMLRFRLSGHEAVRFFCVKYDKL